jgi:exportin-2 (importin alpha re-exporter)
VNQLIEQNKSNPQALPSLFQILHVILGLFHSLSFVDLPEYFEDHLKEWMDGFNRYLSFEPQYPELVSTVCAPTPLHCDTLSETTHASPSVLQNDEEEGVLQKVQAAICENINLYTTKYEEEFAGFLPVFVGSVWSLLVKVGPQMKNDAVRTCLPLC